MNNQSPIDGTVLNNAYLILVYGSKKNDYYIPEYTIQQKKDIQNFTNTIVNKTKKDLLVDAGKRVGMALYTSPIVQNFVGKQLPSGLFGRLNSSLYDIMADGKISSKEVADDFIRSCTGALDNTALNLGLPSASSLYNALKPDGTGIFSLDAKGTAEKFVKEFAKSSQEENEKREEIENRYLDTEDGVIKFKLVSKDTEKWTTDVPTRKTESGLFLAPVLGNHNLEKSFTATIVDEEYSMYDIKQQLYNLRDMRESFDIYIIDDDVKFSYRLLNCVFTDIDVSINGKNSLVADMNIMKIPEYVVLIDENLDTKQKTSKKSNGSSNSKQKSANKKNKTKASSKTTKTNSTFKKYSKRSIYENANEYKRKYLQSKSPTEKANYVARCKKTLNSYKKYQWTDKQIEAAFKANWDFQQ